MLRFRCFADPLRVARPGWALLLGLALLGGCGESAKQPFEAGVWPNPTLPPPNATLIPTVSIAKTVGWSGGAMPVAPPGFKVTAPCSPWPLTATAQVEGVMYPSKPTEPAAAWALLASRVVDRAKAKAIVFILVQLQVRDVGFVRLLTTHWAICTDAPGMP